jgi:hypothetical protein
MGNSLFDAILLAGQQLVNGGSSGGSGTTVTVNTANSFSAGNAVYNNNGTWTLATANEELTASAVGVIQSATALSFVVVLAGVINTTGMGFAANTTYFLSDVTAGLLTSTAPTNPLSYYLPVLQGSSNTSGTVVGYWPAALTALSVVNGGTGATTLTGILLGNGTGPITNISAITSIRIGTSAAMTSGSVTVSDTGCTSSSQYFFSPYALGTVTIPSSYYAQTRTPGTSFVIKSSSAVDTSTINWIAIN